jgi:hypothetical protein
MPLYHVIWEIDLDSETPKEAAERALEIHRDPESIATVFHVRDEYGNFTKVDLSDDGEA